jgi:hypothetical protein
MPPPLQLLLRHCWQQAVTMAMTTTILVGLPEMLGPPLFLMDSPGTACFGLSMFVILVLLGRPLLTVSTVQNERLAEGAQSPPATQYFILADALGMSLLGIVNCAGGAPRTCAGGAP